MSLPSSPPPLPEELFNDPPSSPPLPPAPWPSRKRHADYESSLSSDPIFSEDASEDSDLNGGYKKKKYTKGPWFKSTPLSLQRTAVSASRNHDSGVWMGSDSSTDSIGGCDRRVQTLSFQDFAVKRAPALATTAKKAQTPEDIAASIVFKCVDACQQTIDLSEMRLRTLRNEALRPLHQLIRLPIDMNDDQKITPDHYAPLTPEIKLFLAKNELVSLPPELWNLGNITVLSLRNNELTELSPSISRLRNLQELNIAGNQLQWLPWELLDLLSPQHRKLLRVSLGPNPYVEPCEKRPLNTIGRLRTNASASECARVIRQLRHRFPDQTQSESSYESLLLRLYEARLHQVVRNAGSIDCEIADKVGIPESNTQPIYVASSKPTFLAIDGREERSPMSSFSQAKLSYAACLAPIALPAVQTSAAPSLLELSARACARSVFINQLTSLLPDDASPLVVKALNKAIDTKETGLHTCSVCRKQYVIPRAEWIEYWFDGHGSGEQFLPFMRRTCSWACVQRLADTRTQELSDIKDAVSQVEASLPNSD